MADRLIELLGRLHRGLEHPAMWLEPMAWVEVIGDNYFSRSATIRIPGL
jgi:hypothetical protein